MKKYLLYALVLHGVVFVLFALDLPFLRSRPPETPPPMAVEMVPEDVMPDAPKPTEAPDPEPSPPKPAPPKPPPRSVTPKPSPKVEAPPEPKVAEKPQPAPSMPLKAPPKPSTKPKPPPKPVEEPPPPQETVEAEPAPTPPEPEQAAEDFTSVLKNLTESEPTPERKRPEQEPDPDSTVEAEPEDIPQDDTVSSTLSQFQTMLWISAVRSQIQGCWIAPVGVRDIADMRAEIRVTMTPDRTVQRAEVVDQARLRSDPFFRTFAESAIRAVRSPECSPLTALPADRYDTWKTFILDFSPDGMM